MNICDRRSMLLAALALPAAPARAAGDWKNSFAGDLREDFLRHWRSTREYSLDVVDAMPAGRFDFKPTAPQRTFAEQVAHFGRANTGYFSAFGKQTATARPAPPDSLEKPAVRAFLERSFDYVEEVLGELTEADFLRRDLKFRPQGPNHTAQEIFLRAYMHTAHHRGQVVVYLRLQGIEPPAWRFAAVG